MSWSLNIDDNDNNCDAGNDDGDCDNDNACDDDFNDDNDDNVTQSEDLPLTPIKQIVL